MDYAVPGNDDAIRAVRLIAGAMADAIIEGRQGESFAEAEEMSSDEEGESIENADNFEKDNIKINYQNLTDIDNWILSRYNNLLKSYIENMDKFEITKTVRELSDFVVEDLSNWYIRRNRRKFWKSEADNDKMAVYATTYEICYNIPMNLGILFYSQISPGIIYIFF